MHLIRIFTDIYIVKITTFCDITLCTLVDTYLQNYLALQPRRYLIFEFIAVKTSNSNFYDDCIRTRGSVLEPYSGVRSVYIHLHIYQKDTTSELLDAQIVIYYDNLINTLPLAKKSVIKCTSSPSSFLLIKTSTEVIKILVGLIPLCILTSCRSQ
jgi:hypothetical protein